MKDAEQIPLVKTGEPPAGNASSTGVSLGAPAPAARPPMVSSGDVTIDLFRLAIERGLDVSQLKELNALRVEIEAGEARKHFFRALAAFQAGCPPIRKTKKADVVSERTGTQFGYSWAPLDEIERTVRPLLTKNGLSYSWDEAQEGDAITTTCIVRHEAGHAERTSVKLKVAGSPGMSEHQKVASTMQFGRRQSLTSALGLSTTDEAPDTLQSAEKITDDQVTVLTDRLTETRTQVSRFLKHFGIARLQDLRAIDYEIAVGILDDRQKGTPEKKT